MVDVASITVAVISLVASFGVAVASGVLTIYSDERKARRETERLLRKYRDPLLLGEYTSKQYPQTGSILIFHARSGARPAIADMEPHRAVSSHVSTRLFR
jgi:hypothetical protein